MIKDQIISLTNEKSALITQFEEARKIKKKPSKQSAPFLERVGNTALRERFVYQGLGKLDLKMFIHIPSSALLSSGPNDGDVYLK